MTMIWKRKITLAELNRRCQNTMVGHLGITFTEMGTDHLIAQMPIDQRTLQPLGTVHGGATAALAETVASAAANCCIEEGKIAVGLDLNINHIKAGIKGLLTAHTKPLHLGKTTQVWEIKIMNEEGQLTSAARLTIAILAKS